MAKRLTEEMVIARTKISDLSKIKRLNCWGSELVDVSLLRRMPSVEVLSLSINKINSLADFQLCKRLEELYIRQNEICDLNEIVYLQNLTNLRNLWLGENPCANIDGYRLAVIKALPHLHKLDNVQITQDELREAQRRGKTLIHPDDVQDYEQQYYDSEVREDEQNNEEEEEEEEIEYLPLQQQQQQQQEQRHQQYNKYQESETEYSPLQRSPPLRQQPEYENEDNEDVYQRDEVPEGSKDCSPARQTSPPPRRTNDIITMTRRNYSPEQQINNDGRNNYEREQPIKQSTQYYNRCPADNYEVNTTCDYNYREIKIVNSQSANCLKDYTNGDRYQQQQQHHHQPQQQQQHYRQEANDQSYGYERRERYSCQAANHRPSFQRRIVTRNSNILSAVLRLVKELDYPSLEVVEMEVRSRMDELVDE